MPHKEGKYEDVYVVAYIITKKQLKSKMKPSKNGYLFREREPRGGS